MPTPWSAPIKAAKQLSIFPTSKVTGGPWKAVFTKALAEFNALSAKHSLGVTFAIASSAPDPSGVGGADVQFDTINGTANFTCFNQAFSDKLSGNAMEGHTKVISQVFGSTKSIAKAFIFVPATPRVGAASSRVVGDPVKLVIATHEMIHACGLDNSEHTALKDADLFFDVPSLRDKVHPADDRIAVGNPIVEMPPLFLSAPTIKLIQTNW
ncbi:conserved hypothetical protein [Methylocella tundrae]|uniref:Peptidase M10 metallopeptidase domain-containing protein n=1 Tax=Methylocella tundrae TaxID=227605 RepID=A0A8B6M4R8_METTU|nr:hypothetical protein [Methylocella tundrae]VTZ27058.1 conserved hypothetical protein [Methylocella tundrae]VTZ50001.1 conserved hypothetical protein [Methylocella tundrae]